MGHFLTRKGFDNRSDFRLTFSWTVFLLKMFRRDEKLGESGDSRLWQLVLRRGPLIVFEVSGRVDHDAALTVDFFVHKFVNTVIVDVEVG